MGTSVLIRKKIDLLTVRLHWRYLLCAPIEEVKVPKLETNSLSGLSDELVRTVERFWVGSGVRWREQLLATVPEKRECKETILAENFFLRIFQNFFLRMFYLPRNLFPWMAKLHSRLFPSTRPSGTPIFVNRAAKEKNHLYQTYKLSLITTNKYYVWYWL